MLEGMDLKLKRVATRASRDKPSAFDVDGTDTYEQRTVAAKMGCGALMNPLGGHATEPG